MDDLDRSLIALLRTDARMPVSSLAPRLGVSRATVRARIDRLVETGVIQGFTVALAKTQSDQVRAVMMIEVVGRSAEPVFRRLMGFSEIQALYSTNGRWDIVAEIEVPDLQTFDEALREIRQVDGISASETHILLANRKLLRSAG